jgi:hypothetical protein
MTSIAEDVCCAICLDNVDASMNIIKTECNHCFHSKCFLQNAAHNGFSCPMCRNELASVPTDDDDSDDEYGEEDDEDEDEEDFLLRGARWLMMRAEGEEIEEDDTDDESIMSDDSDIYLRDDPEIEELPNTSIAYISQKMLARGITFEEMVALYVLPHSANAFDTTVYNKDVLKNLRKTIYDIAFEPETAPIPLTVSMPETLPETLPEVTMPLQEDNSNSHSFSVGVGTLSGFCSLGDCENLLTEVDAAYLSDADTQER